MITRRKLIGGFGLLIAAPAIIRVADLMPIKAVEEKTFTFHANKLYTGEAPPRMFVWSSRPDLDNWNVTFRGIGMTKIDKSVVEAGDLQEGQYYKIDIETGLLTSVTL